MDDHAWLQFRAFTQGWTNAAAIRHRHVNGWIVSVPQAGSHWLKFMMGHAIAAAYGAPPPENIQDERLCGHPRRPPRDLASRFNFPVTVHSHTMPHRLMRRASIRHALHFPRYVILVRDLRAALVSNFEKWKDRYNCDFSTYLHGDVRFRKRSTGIRFNSDIWMRMRFLNEWGDIMRRDPARFLVIRYEDMVKDPAAATLSTLAHFGFSRVTAEHARLGAARATKDEMAAASNDRQKRVVVRDEKRHWSTWFSADDRKFMAAVTLRNLVHPFGYDYQDSLKWQPAPP